MAAPSSARSFKRILQALTGDALVYGLSMISTRLISLLLFPLFTKVLGPDEYAVVNLLGSSSVLTMLICSMGLDSAAARWFFDNDEETRRKSVISTYFIGSLCASLIAVVVMFVGSWYYLNNYLTVRGNVALISGFVALNLLLTLCSNVTNLWLVLNRRTWSAAILSVFQSGSSIGLSALFVLTFRWGLNGFYGAQFLASGITVIGCWLLVLRRVVRWPLWSPPLFREMFSYGRKLIIAPISGQAGTLITGMFINAVVAQSALGHYQVGLTLSTVVLFVVYAFGQAFGPVSLEIKDNPNAKQSFVLLLHIYAICLAGISLVVGIVAEDLIRVFLSAQFIPSAPLAALLCYSTSLNGLQSIASTGLTITKRIEYFGRVQLIVNLAAIPVSYVCISQGGILAACIVQIVQQGIITLFIFYFSNKVYPIKYNLSIILLIFCLSATAYGLASSPSINLNNLTGKILILIAFTASAIVILFAQIKLYKKN